MISSRTRMYESVKNETSAMTRPAVRNSFMASTSLVTRDIT